MECFLNLRDDLKNLLIKHERRLEKAIENFLKEQENNDDELYDFYKNFLQQSLHNKSIYSASFLFSLTSISLTNNYNPRKSNPLIFVLHVVECSVNQYKSGTTAKDIQFANITIALAIKIILNHTKIDQNLKFELIQITIQHIGIDGFLKSYLMEDFIAHKKTDTDMIKNRLFKLRDTSVFNLAIDFALISYCNNENKDKYKSCFYSYVNNIIYVMQNLKILNQENSETLNDQNKLLVNQATTLLNIINGNTSHLINLAENLLKN